MTENNITRRGFAAFAATAGIAMAAGLSGCAPKETKAEFDVEAGYLPLGSVVVIDYYQKAGIKLMVTARRPKASTVSTDKSPDGIDMGETVFDYAGCYWPFGYTSDLSEHSYTGESYVFNASQIAEVLHVGYQDDLETKASALLDESKSKGTTSAVALSALHTQVFVDGVNSAYGVEGGPLGSE